MKEKHTHTKNPKKPDVEKYKEMINFEIEREGCIRGKDFCLLFEFLFFSYHEFETGNRFNLPSIA